MPKRRIKKDTDLWQEIMNRFILAEQHVKSQRDIWRKGEDFLYGNHWRGSRMQAHKSKIVINDVFEAIETMLPVITSRAPKIEVRPKPRTAFSEEITQDMTDMTQAYAEGLEREFDDIWKKTKMNRKNRENFRNMKCYGNGIIKSTKVIGQQRMNNELLDIFTCFPDPSKASIQECEEGGFFIHAPLEYVHEIKRKFGVDVPPEGQLNQYRAFQFSKTVQESPSGAEQTPISDTEYERIEQIEKIKGEDYTIEDQAQLIECWYFDDTMEDMHESITLEDGTVIESEAVIGSYPKYPNGRVTVIAPNLKDGTIIADYPNPYPHFPFFMIKNYSESHSFWGRPEFKQIETLLKAENMTISQVVDNIRLTANPKGEKLRGANIKDEELTNEPGTFYESNVKDGFNWKKPESMPRYVIDFLKIMSNKKDNTTGIQDAWRGRAAGAAESGRHADILRSQTAGRIQPAVEEMVDMIRDLANHWSWVIQNMFDAEKYHQVKDQMGNLSYKKFMGMALNPDDNVVLPANSVDFDVELSVGALLPHDRDREFEETKVLAEAGLCDPEMVVDAAPNIRDKARAKKWIREQQQMQQANQPTPEDMQILQSGNQDAIFQLLSQKPELKAYVEQLRQGAA